METSVAWPIVVDFMRKRCGLVLHDDQRYLLASRVVPVATRLGYGSVLRFVQEACRDDATRAQVELLVDALTTHETSFFRDPGFWTFFVGHALPQLERLVRARGSATVWSAACSTGQEPYTVAMLLEEEAPHVAPHVRIVGTDVSVPVLERAAEAVFGPHETARGLDPSRLARHLEPVAGGQRVRQHLRRRVSFEAHNLLGDGADPRADLVLCRNVLIYFDKLDRERVVKRLFRSLRAAGYVGVGTTELVAARSVAPGWYRHEG